MQWLLVCLESLASGVLAVLGAVGMLVAALHLYTRHVLGFASGQEIGWDPVSILGPHWKLAVIGIPLVILAGGFGLGFWFFSQRVHR